MALTPVALVLLAYVGFWTAVYCLPYPSRLAAPPLSSTIIQDSDSTPLAAFVASDGQWRLPLQQNELSPHLLDALVAVEDSRFYNHAGVDWRSAAMAAWEDLRGMHIRRGASTLTMQLQRLRDPAPRSWFNKLDQAVRAAQIERTNDKNQILAEYANRAPFGGNLVGAGAASWRYFGKPCSQLSVAEAALLAGLPQSPNRLRPDRHPAAALLRRRHVLDRMFAMNMIDRRQHDEADAEPLAALWRPLPQDHPASSSADGALPTFAWLARKTPGRVLRTTFDTAVQRQACLAAADQLSRLDSSGVDSAAVVVLDTATSQCLAAVSLSKPAGQIDLVRRPRSTGSTLKPFIYAAAFDWNLIRPDSLLDDSPASWVGYEPVDYDHTFRGSMTAAEALAESRNIPAMLVLSKVGVEPTIGVMEAAGLRKLARAKRHYGLSLAIGGAEATPLELAQAYAALGRGGAPAEVAFLHPLSPPSAGVMGGGVVRPILRAESCWQTLVALSQFDRTNAICPAATRTNVAWKTGTSNGHRDAWCAAVTRHRTVVVWLGNARGEGSAALVGAEAAAPLALRLIASLDSEASEPWPIVTPSFKSEPAREKVAPTSLAMIWPTPGQQFVIDPDSPTDRQRILLKAALRPGGVGSLAGGGHTVWWFVDGRPAGVCDAGATLWWPPARGRHEIRVIDSSGHAAVANVVVR